VVQNSPQKPLIREFAAGGVVFRKFQISNDKFQIRWLVTRGISGPKFPDNIWRLPKGWLDDRESGEKPGPLASGEKKATQEEIREAALKEVREEGGVKAKIIRKLDTEKYFLNYDGQKILKFVTFYLMEWDKDLPEGFGWETQEIDWLTFEDAQKRLSYKREKEVLIKAEAVLKRGIQESLI